MVFEQGASQFGQFSALATPKFMRFPAMIVLSSKNIILTYLQKLKSLDLLMTQDSSLRKAINHKKCNFQENKNSQVMKERENLHDILRESSFNITRRDEDIEGGGATKIFRHPKGGLLKD